MKFLFMETFATFAVFNHKHMEAKERFKVVYSADATEFLQRITSKAREKIISNARKASYTIDPKLFKKLTGTDLWEYTASLKKEYAERIAPALKSQFQYSSSMQVPVLKKIVINQGLGMAVADKKIIEVAINEMTAITGQKAVATISRKDIANFKLRKKMPIGVMVTLRRERMYEFLEKLVRVALPRIRDFKGIESKFDGKGNYTLGIQEQIIFPEINIDSITRILGMNITFVTSAETDEEGYALLKEFGLPFKKCVPKPRVTLFLKSIPLKSRIRGRATRTNFSRNSYILSRRKVTITPIGIFLRNLKLAISLREMVATAF